MGCATHLSLQVYNYFTFNIDVFKGQIQAYDPQNFNVGIAKESGLVPLLLAPIWLLFPYLQASLHVQFEIVCSDCLTQISYVVHSHTCSSAWIYSECFGLSDGRLYNDMQEYTQDFCPHHA